MTGVKGFAAAGIGAVCQAGLSFLSGNSSGVLVWCLIRVFGSLRLGQVGQEPLSTRQTDPHGL